MARKINYLAAEARLGRDNLVPLAADDVPKAVQEANASAAAAFDALEEASEKYKAARRAARDAARQDKAADAVAAADAEELPERTEPALKRAADEAERQFKAAKRLTIERVLDLHVAIQDVGDAWIASLEASMGDRGDRVEKLVEQLRTELDSAAVNGEVLVELRRRAPNKRVPTSPAYSFAHPDGFRNHEREKRHDAKVKQHARERPDSMVPRRLEHLLPAVETLISEHL